MGKASVERLRPEPDEGGLDAMKGNGVEHCPLDRTKEVVEEASQAVEEDGEGQAGVCHGTCRG